MSGTSSIISILKPKDKDIGDFSVRRALPFINHRSVGPWVFFDHFGPVEFEPGQGIDVRPHPHINLATVSYLFEGEIFHRDSLGYAQPILPGAINLMVAGKGIVHSERTREALRADGYRLHGLQLWMALPEDKEEIEPAFYHHPAETIPTVKVENVDVRVMMGSAYGVTSPVETFSDTLYLEADMPAGSELTLPPADELAVYVVSGEVEIDDQDITRFSLAVLDPKADPVVRAKSDCRLALIGGEPLGHRHMYWNFISSRKDRIAQAKSDWKAGAFGKVVGDEDDFIPLPD